MFNIFFNKPIQVVAANEIRQGDYIHSVSDPDCPVEMEKRKGYVVEIASSPTAPQLIELKLTNRLTSLKVLASVTAVITRKESSEKKS